MSVLKEQWIAQAYEQFKLIFPDESKKTIMEFLERKFDEDFKDCECMLYNNYEMEQYDTTLSKIIDWTEKEKPIMTESGTFFKKHSDCDNPNGTIIKAKLDGRSIEKDKKFEYVQLANNENNPDLKYKYDELAKKCDLAQSRLKVQVNSVYGVNGMPSSFLFNFACASSITLKGQTLIATAFNSFENFLEDNVKFFDMDECLAFVINIKSEKDDRKKDDCKWVRNKLVDDVYLRLLNKFENREDCVDWVLRDMLSSLSQEDLNRIYYKCNLYEFFRNSDKAVQLLRNIMQAPENFMDPVKAPRYIGKLLDKLNGALIEYVHYNYPIYNRSLRLKISKRRATVTIDTDSNMINLGPWKDFIHNEIICDYKRIKRRKMKNGLYIVESRKESNRFDTKRDQQESFRIINTMAHILGNMLSITLNKFVASCNVEPGTIGTIKMKNEFLYEKMLTTSAKKHYQAIIRLQEGKYFPVPKPDIKGMEYMKKSYSSEYTTKFISDLVYNDILCKKGIPDVRKLLNKISEFEDSISDSILGGEFKFIKNVKIKTADAYVDPLSNGPYKAVYVWNYLYPDKEIELPGSAYILKVGLEKPKEFAQLSITNPEMFNKLMTLFERNDKIKKSGITNIAIPLEEKIPEWMKPYIKLDEIIMNNIKLIIPVLNSLGVKTINRSKSSAFFSNIIQL